MKFYLCIQFNYDNCNLFYFINFAGIVIGKKKKELIGKEERTKTDKKRERRKKKQFQKIKRKQKEARQLLNDQLSKKYSVEKATKDLKKLSNNRAVQV